MNMFTYALMALSPFIYMSVAFQSLPLLLRGYLPAAIIIILFRKRPRHGIFYGIYAAIVMDVFLSQSIGAYLILHVVLLFALYGTKPIMPKPSSMALALTSTIIGYGVELVYFMLLITLGWKVHQLAMQPFITIPIATGIYTLVIGTLTLNKAEDYTVFRRDTNA